MSDFLKINELKDNLVKLIEAKFELTKLNVQDKIEGIAVKAVYALFTFILGIVVIIFLSILLAIGINFLLKSTWVGFLIIFLLYAILLSIFIFSKDAVLSSIKKQVEEITDENLNDW
jgi:ABC-type transport system involved in multi-copper enzyme maturation permease subunit